MVLIKKLLQILLIVLVLFFKSNLVLAYDYDDGMAAYESDDYQTALDKWMPLASQGNSSAQYNLGVMYDQGQGVIQDHIEAHK